MRRLLLLVAVLALVAVGVGGWWFFIRDDSPPPVALSATSGQSSGGPATPDGTWTVRPDAKTFVGYRITEKLARLPSRSEAVGRTPAVTGTVVIAGASVTKADVTADLTKLHSDESRRDSRVRTDGLQTNQFPTGEFHLTQPIALTQAPAKGTMVNLTAVGTLTIHGVTKPVQVAITARWTGPTLEIVGHVPIVFADYKMTALDFSGIVTTDDHGTMELSLVLDPPKG